MGQKRTSPLNPNIIFGGAVAALMARIEHAPRLDQQQLDLILGIRLVLNALRDNKHLTGRNVNDAIPKMILRVPSKTMHVSSVSL
jgi:hypothetical protein